MVVTITENENNSTNIIYIKQALGEVLSQAGGEIRTYLSSNRACVKLDCPEYYSDILRVEALDKVAEIIAVKYKYDFFKKNIKIGGLSQDEKEILYASLIAADLDEDKKYAFSKIKQFDNLSVDGIFNFMLTPLKNKWSDIVSYLPPCFMGEQLRDFVSYLIEPRKCRVYVEGCSVYDNHYRRLKRCDLLGGENTKLTRELILSNCGEIEVTGKIPELDEMYIREYYGDKVCFR